MAAPKAQQNIKEEILEAASRLFAGGSVASVSLLDIAAAVNIAKGTLYYYYPAKEALVQDVAERHFIRLSSLLYAWIDSLANQPDPRAAFTALSGMLLQNQELLRLRWALLHHAVSEGGPLQARFCAKAREWAVLIEVGALKLPGPEAEALRRRADLVLPILDGWSLHALAREPLDPEALVSLLLHA